jgi:vacuolar-type H+-ATPase subunit H
VKVVIYLSMLDDIKAAEEAAAAEKREAAVSARNLIRNGEDTANAKARSVILAAREAAKTTIANANAQAQVKAKSLIHERAEADRFAAEAARKKLPEAAAYIVEKVVI